MNRPSITARNILFLSLLCCSSPLYSIDRTVAGSPDPASSDQPESVERPTLSPEALGDVLLARRRYVEAIESYRLEPNLSSALWNKLGIAHQHLLNDREARRDYERALDLDPKNAEATNNLGTVFYSQKDYKRAMKLYKHALKLNPKCSTVYINLGTALFAIDKYKQGAATYRQALAVDPQAFDHDNSAAIPEGTPPHQRAELNYYLAKTYAEAGKNEQALKYLRRAFSQGFSDRKKLMSDKEFASLRETAEFRELLTQEHLN